MIKNFLFLLALMAILSCGNKGSSKKEITDYDASREKLAERERKHPLEFLTITSRDKRNFIGQTVVKGDIGNTATITSYKNVRIKLLYYRQGTLVANHEQVENELIKPNHSNTYKAKYFTPKKTDSVAVTIMSADVR